MNSVNQSLELFDLNNDLTHALAQDTVNDSESLFEDTVCFHQDEIR